ncbi:MAG TPA: hypothetical protein VMR31_07810 [Myxococcota bacterium]|nr:hypothetical protein [Myxococcota bacterium]
MSRLASVSACALLLLSFAPAARGGDASTATLRVSPATAGSSFGHLVEGVLTFRDRDVLVTLRGVNSTAESRGAVFGLARPRDIEGKYKGTGAVVQNESGVRIQFDPPLAFGADGFEIAIQAGMQPKVSRGGPGSGVEQ